MKINIILLIVTITGFSLNAQAQDKVQIDSDIAAFKTYLSKNVRFPAVAAENNVQGKMVVTIRLNYNKMIDSVWFYRHIFPECDSEVVKKIRQYSKPLALSELTYSIGFQFVILEQDEPEEKVTPFNASDYKNFLFGVEIKRVFMKRKTTIVY